jgi:hypothetical protein
MIKATDAYYSTYTKHNINNQLDKDIEHIKDEIIDIIQDATKEGKVNIPYSLEKRLQDKNVEYYCIVAKEIEKILKESGYSTYQICEFGGKVIAINISWL